MTDLIRAHAQSAIRQAVLAALEAFLAQHDDTDGQGRRNVVRNGYKPERQVLTGVGPIEVRLPKTRDRSGQGRGFRSLILPPYLKKTRGAWKRTCPGCTLKASRPTILTWR